MHRIKVAILSHLQPERVHGIEVDTAERGKIPLCLVTTQGSLYAVEGTCPHNGSSLAGGFLDGATLMCPQHFWAFRLDTGQIIRPLLNVCLRTYPVVVEDDTVYIVTDADPPTALPG